MEKKELWVDEPYAGWRVDKFLAEKADWSRSFVQKLLEAGLVEINNRKAKASDKLKTGDLVLASCLPPAPLALEAEQIPLKIIYEDEDLVVVDKPAGLVVHPAPGHPSGTLVNALLARLPDLAGIGGTLRPGIVHRLDKDTSGLLVVAKNQQTQDSLSKQIKNRLIKKYYLALVWGHLTPQTGRIEVPIDRDKSHRKRMAPSMTGREAISGYRVLEYLSHPTKGLLSLVEVEPETGRTHQIRVHFSYIGYPIVGDPVYGRRRKISGLERQFLHACRLGFSLPRSGQWVEFESPLPEDLGQVLRSLGYRPAMI